MNCKVDLKPLLHVETFRNSAAKQVSAGTAQYNIKRQDLFGNVETGLKMLLHESWPTCSGF